MINVYILCGGPSSEHDISLRSALNISKNLNEEKYKIKLVYINKKATFRYLEPSLISAYFKAVKPEYAGKDGNDYNDLDLVYFVKITQADGVTCDAEAVVRFSNIIQNKDGTFTYDFSNPKIMSASYSDSSIKKNVISRYETTHVIEKLPYTEYY